MKLKGKSKGVFGLEICAVLGSTKQREEVEGYAQWFDLVIGKNPPLDLALSKARGFSSSSKNWIDLWMDGENLKKFFERFEPMQKCIFNSINRQNFEIFEKFGKQKFAGVVVQGYENFSIELALRFSELGLKVFYDPVFFPRLDPKSFSDFVLRGKRARERGLDVVCAVWNEVWFFEKNFSVSSDGIVWFALWLLVTLSFSDAVDVVMIPAGWVKRIFLKSFDVCEKVGELFKKDNVSA